VKRSRMANGLVAAAQGPCKEWTTAGKRQWRCTLKRGVVKFNPLREVYLAKKANVQHSWLNPTCVRPCEIKTHIEVILELKTGSR
jgi:hypothetical protein